MDLWARAAAMTTGNPASLSETWSKVEELLKRRDPEKEPYKSRYEALKLLRDARKALEGNEGETEVKARAALDHRIGLTKISVEERGEEARNGGRENFFETLMERRIQDSILVEVLARIASSTGVQGNYGIVSWRALRRVDGIGSGPAPQ